jgi:hypothetical protein
MKRGIHLFVLFFGLLSYPALSQQAPEKIYVQTDRDYYSVGETIHFKAFVLSEDSLPSTHFFIELWDSSFNKMAGLCLPVIDATVAGSITIPAKEYRGPVFLRAYTENMQWQRSRLQFVKQVLGPAKVANDLPVQTHEPRFFPEGGSLVYHAVNYVAFDAFPGFSGLVKNSKGVEVAKLDPLFNGKGLFKFRPRKGDVYSCHWSENGTDRVTALPTPLENGIALHCTQSNDTLFFEIDMGAGTGSRLQRPRVQLMVNNEIGYLIDLSMNGNSRFSYYMPLRALQPGIATFMVFDDSMKVVAQRPLFISRKYFEPTTSIHVLEKSLDRRGNNRFLLHFKDSMLREVTVSITDADYNDQTASPGFLSTFLPDAALVVFESSANELQEPNLDLVLQTMDTVVVKGHPISSKPDILRPNYLQLTGIIKTGKKVVANKEVLVALRSEYTGRELYKVVTDAEGKFVLDGLILYGEVFVHCRLAGKENEQLSYEFKLDLPSANEDLVFFQSFKETAGRLFPAGNASFINTGSAKDSSMRIDSLVFAEKGIMLQEVVLKVNPRKEALRKMAELENKYLAGTGFAGYATQAETVDVLNDPFAHKSTSLAAYIAAKFHMIKVKYSTGRAEYFYPIRAIAGDTIIRTFYLNGNKITSSMLDGIRLEDIALIKFFPMLGMEIGLPPAIAIFLRKPGDYAEWETEKIKHTEKKIQGYPVTKSLPMPDYSKSELKVESDTRKTLLWQPYTKVEKGMAEIKFYNNDATKRFRIVVEGVSSNGNIVFFEKIVE